MSGGCLREFLGDFMGTLSGELSRELLLGDFLGTLSWGLFLGDSFWVTPGGLSLRTPSGDSSLGILSGGFWGSPGDFLGTLYGDSSGDFLGDSFR